MSPFYYPSLALSFLLNSALSVELRGAASDRELFICTNTDWNGGLDTGCTDILPNCVSDEGFDIPYLATGAKCVKCVNSVTSAAFTDMGCTTSAPICALDSATADPPNSGAGTQCVALSDSNCLNDGVHGGKDTGCPTDRPICLGPNGKEPAADVRGDQCVRCVNAFNSYTNADFGCDNANPVCTIATGEKPEVGAAGAHCAVAALVLPLPCTETYENVTGDVFGSVIYFNGGNALPPSQGGRYTVTYIGGCLKHYNRRTYWEDVKSWFLVGNSSDTVIVRLPPPGTSNRYATFKDCEDGTLARDPLSVDFTLPLASKIGVWLNDPVYIDNVPGTPSPTWKLELQRC